MTENNRLKEIKERLASNAYFLNPHADASVRDDIAYLLSLIDELEKKSKALSQHAMELTQEMENIRSDFGGDQR